MEINFPLLLDGATGTQLQKRGLAGNSSAEQWVLEHPQELIDIQRAYIDAGSQVIYAPTFGANRVKLEEHHIFGQVDSYNRRLVDVTKKAAGGRVLVAGDMAPTGKFLYPLGDMRFEDFVDIYAEQAAALENAGVDLFVIETMMTLPEARAAYLAVRSVSRKPVFVSFTCDENGRTYSGTDVAAALQVMQGMGVDVFGLNCSVGPDLMLEQIKRLGRIATVPLLAKPNAGLPVTENGNLVYPAQPEEFAEYLPAFAACGVQAFGGCCGTDERFLKAMHDRLSGLTMKKPSPEHRDMLPCATEKEVCFLPPDAAGSHVLSCSTDLEDDIEEEEDSRDPVISIAITKEEDLSYFEDVQSSIRKPLCLVCSDKTLLEKALRLYQGRALYDGTLTEKELMPLVRRYGLII